MPVRLWVPNHLAVADEHAPAPAQELGAAGRRHLRSGATAANHSSTAGAIAIQRLDPHRTRFEAFRRNMLVDDVLAVHRCLERGRVPVWPTAS
jgi:hypothetical protein